MKIHGLTPATLTPFREDFSIDFAGLTNHIQHTAAATGLFGITVNGHAGEVLTLSSDERQQVIAAARAALPTPLKLIAGIESHATDGLVREGLRAKEAGADLLLVVPPFDIRTWRHLSHDADSVYKVFERLDREVGLPMIVFSYPDASGSAYSLEALRRVVTLKNVVAIKCSAGTPAKYAEMHDALHHLTTLLVAVDTPSMLGMLMHHAPGALVGIAVVGTQQWSDLVHHATMGDANQAKRIHNRFAVPLMRAIFEYHTHRTPTCPFGATKEALLQLGLFPSSVVRAPGVRVNAAKRLEIRAALIEAGLLSADAPPLNLVS
jgi:4-hydroxy-tetrahydrodipicolinate synthase